MHQNVDSPPYGLQCLFRRGLTPNCVAQEVRPDDLDDQERLPKARLNVDDTRGWRVGASQNKTSLSLGSLLSGLQLSEDIQVMA